MTQRTIWSRSLQEFIGQQENIGTILRLRVQVTIIALGDIDSNSDI